MLKFVFEYFFNFWWLILPFILGLIVWEKRLQTVRILYAQSIKWSYLELKTPLQVGKSIQSMEEIFSSLHSAFSKKSDYQRYIKGYLPPYFVFILFAHKGFLKFYIRTPENLKNFVKTRIYAQYPHAEINEVDDPINFLPPKSPNPLTNCFLAEMTLTKKEPYPIKTYKVWERAAEEERIDPLSFLSEGATQLNDDEWIIIQIYAMPVPAEDEDFGNKWVDKGKKEVNKIIGKKEEKEPSPLEMIGEFVWNLLRAPFVGVKWKEYKKDEKEISMQKLTPGERYVLEKLQEKLSKPGYWVSIRSLYFTFEPNFKEKLGRSLGLIFSFFKLYETQNMNAFKPSKTTSPSEVISPFTTKKSADVREFFQKRLMYLDFKSYSPPQEKFILNTEEMASIFHIPLETVPETTIEKAKITPRPAPPTVPEPDIF